MNAGMGRVGIMGKSGEGGKWGVLGLGVRAERDGVGTGFNTVVKDLKILISLFVHVLFFLKLFQTGMFGFGG